MNRRILTSMAFALLLCLAFAASAAAGAAFAGDKVPRMQVKELLARIDAPDLMIIDVRRGRDFDGSEQMIKNAVRKAFNDVDTWSVDIPRDKTLVLYCA